MKTVLVTGGTRGIGRAICELFLKRGYRVLFIYNRSEEEARALETAGARAYRADLSKTDQLVRVCDLIMREEKVDVLVNNAGISLYRLFTEMTDEEWRALRSLDLDAPVLISRAFIPGMVQRHGGRIINIASVWGQVGASMEAAYSAVKGGVIALTKALAKELGPSEITVNCICPGVIRTDMNASFSHEDLEELISETPLCRLGEPEDVAHCALYLASDEASFVTGQIIGVNGGFAVN